jgi:hypothetical protein
MLVALWGGLVLSETVIELSARDHESRRHAARLHYWIDLTLELPTVLGVLATGFALLARSGPLTPSLEVKVAAGLLAILGNLSCVVAVILRRRHVDDPQALEVWARRVLIHWTAIPFGVTALVLGLGRAM